MPGRGRRCSARSGTSYRPGTTSYSDSNYIALGGIIEAIERAPFEDDFKRLVAGPLGLSKSSWRYDDSQIGRFAQPTIQRPNGSLFDPWQSGTINTGHWGEVWTDGGLATTATELAEIAHATVMGPAQARHPPADDRLSMRTASDLASSTNTSLGRAWIGHAGLWAGFTSEHWDIQAPRADNRDLDGPGAPARARPTRPRRSSSRWHRSRSAPEPGDGLSTPEDRENGGITAMERPSRHPGHGNRGPERPGHRPERAVDLREAADLGVEVTQITVVGDRPRDLEGALRTYARRGPDLIVTSGGLGPTADD